MKSSKYLLEMLDDADKEKVSALDELYSLSAKYHQSEDFMSLLTFIGKFRNLSPFNAFLVHMQDSSATVVLTAAKWMDYGRRVKPFSRPFIILYPFGPVQFVYNISDTEPIEGKKETVPDNIMHPFKTEGVIDKIIYNRTLNNARKEGITYSLNSMQASVAGFVTTKKENSFEVNLNALFDQSTQYATLVHELAHVYCGHLGTHTTSWWESATLKSTESKEIEAESVTFLVCSRFGIKPNSIEYLSGYVTDKQNLPPISLERILTVANHIEQMGKGNFKAKLTKKKIV